MQENIFPIIGVVCAAFAVVSTIVHYVFKFKELRTLREIRDRLDKSKD